MTQITHKVFQIHRNDRLVLDDQNATGDAVGHFAVCDVDQVFRLVTVHPHDLSHAVKIEFLDGVQQQRLAGVVGQLCQVSLRGTFHDVVGTVHCIDLAGLPDDMQHLEQTCLDTQTWVQRTAIGQDRFQSSGGIPVTSRLRTSQRTRVAA